MNTIWKYDVRVEDLFRVDLPAGAKFLAVQTQRGVPQMWWLVDPHAATERRRFAVHGTGHTVNTRYSAYLGTFQLAAGSLVFHLFEVQL